MLLSQFPLTFLQNQKRIPLFIAVYDYSRDDWDSFCDHLRDDLWEDIFKLVGSGTGN